MNVPLAVASLAPARVSWPTCTAMVSRVDGRQPFGEAAHPRTSPSRVDLLALSPDYGVHVAARSATLGSATEFRSVKRPEGDLS